MNAGQIFVRGVWRIIPSEDDLSWVDRVASSPGDDGPLGDYGAIVRKMLSAGISSADIARFAKIVGYEVAFRLCYHLGDPNASYEGFGDTVPEFEWDLYEVKDGEPQSPISCTHELLLGADPSGREMRPRGGA